MKTQKVETLLNNNNIRASVMTNWSRETNPNCKFTPGHQATVVKQKAKFSNTSVPQRDRRGETGTVIAASSPDGFYMTSPYHSRKNTRYYLAFSDGNVIGFPSNLLK